MQIHIPLECVIEHLIFQETKPGIHYEITSSAFPSKIFLCIILQIPLESPVVFAQPGCWPPNIWWHGPEPLGPAKW